MREMLERLERNRPVFSLLRAPRGHLPPGRFGLLPRGIKKLKSGFKKAFALFRVSNWLHHKIAPLLTPAYFLLLYSRLPVAHGIRVLGGLLLYFLATASLGFFLNDVGDIDSDRRAGKSNWASRLGPRRQVLLGVILAGLSLCPLLLLTPTLILWLLAGAELLCFVLYSFPPTRLKECMLGPLADAAYAHVIPFAIAVVGVQAEPGFLGTQLVTVSVVALGWQFVQGVRNILGHQLEDQAADQRAGVRTFVLMVGQKPALRLHRFVLPVLELALFLGLLALVTEVASPPSAFFVAFVITVGLGNYAAMRRGFTPSADAYFWDRFLNEFCNFWLPALVLASLATQVPSYGVVLLLHLLLFGLPRITFPPSPPTWHVDIGLSEEPEGRVLRVEGWCLLAELNPARVDVLVDGWPRTSAHICLARWDVTDRFALPRDAVKGYAVNQALDWLPAYRRKMDVQVVAVRPDSSRYLLKRTTVFCSHLPEGANPPATLALPGAAVYGRDLSEDLLLDDKGRPRKIALFQVPGIESSFIESYLATFLPGQGYRWHNPAQEGKPEWSPGELASILDRSEEYAFVSNRAGGWPEKVFREYRARGWYCFAFVRDPADQLCCHYFHNRRGQSPGAITLKLDEFLRAEFSHPLPDDLSPDWPPYLPPAFWHELDFIAEYSDETFARFLARFFGHEFSPVEGISPCESPGYQQLLAAGEISEQTDRAYLRSSYRRVYEAALRTPS